MSETEPDTQLSRRQFLAGCAGCAAAASAPAAAAPSIDGPTETHSLGQQGTLSAHGQKLIDDFDREFQPQRAQPSETINVVEDWGLDPTGGEPINGTFESEISGLSNARVVFPGDGVFATDGDLTASPAGPIELIGNGCTLTVPPNTQCRVFEAFAPSGTLIEGFNVDMSAEGTWVDFFVESEGIVTVRDIEMQGYLGPLPEGTTDIDAVLTPIARSESAKIRMRNFVAIGGTAPDMHDDESGPDSPEGRMSTIAGLWVGRSSVGTIQMVDCKLRGWQNGTYAGRTKATVQYLRGTYWNNSNSQIRGSGGTYIDGVTLLGDDRRWSMKKNPGPYSLGEQQGVYAIRVDPGGSKGIQDEPITIVNVDIRWLSIETLSGVIDFEGSAGPGIIRNTKITNHTGVPAVLGEAPGSQGPYGAAPQTNIMMEWSLVTGSTTEVAEVNDRPQSRIQKTCISVPGAGPEGISGMQIGQGVGFGKQCEFGLKNPEKVAKGGKLPELPIPSNPSGPGPDNPGKEGPSKGVFVAVIDGIFMFLFILFGMVVLFIAGILGALGAFAAMIGDD